MIYLSLPLTLLAVYMAKHQAHSRLFSATFSLLVFLSLLMTGVYYASDQLTGSGIDESVLYHLRADLQGAGFNEFSGLIFISAFYCIAVIIVSALAYRITRTNTRPRYRPAKVTMALLFLAVAYLVNPGFSQLRDVYASSIAPPRTVQPPEQFIPISHITFSQNRKNVVYLFLESLERTYFDETLFPGLLPRLKRLQDESISFTEIEQVFGTGWTVGGMTAAKCGIPLVTPSHGNSMSGTDLFLPEATCLGDVLVENGYALNYLGGADLEFAGKGSLFRTHGFESVEGLQELRGLVDDPGYLSSWGLYDDSLFAIARDRYAQLTKRDVPFGLFLLTLDTHHPNGHLSASCQDTAYRDGRNPILNAVHCADQIVADFIQFIRQSEAFANTVLVVASDHLAMRNTAWDQLQKGDRRNLFMVFADGLEPAAVSRSGSLLDVAPTVLHLMGGSVDAFGFGRSLLADPPTLAESEPSLNDLLAGSRGYLSSLWDFPRIDRGIRVDVAARQLFLGDRYVRFPALFLINEDLSVNEIHFEIASATKLRNKVATLPYDQRFVWVDECESTGMLAEGVGKEGRTCAVYGALGFDQLEASTLPDGTVMQFRQLRRVLADNSLSEESHRKKAETLNRISQSDTSDVIELSMEPDLGGRFMIRSAGFGAGDSLARNGAHTTEVLFTRGLTLVGFNINEAPVKLGHIDSCDGTIVDSVGLERDFATLIRAYSGQFGAFSVVAHDSALCGSFEFSELFQGTGLKRWNEIGWRTPYIGIVSGNGDVAEFIGTVSGEVVVDAAHFVRPLQN
jgi:hypothetical protein